MNNKQIYAAIVSVSRKGTIPISILEKQSLKAYAKFIAQHGYTKNSELLFNFLNPGASKACIECGEPTKFKRFQMGYAEYCSHECKYRPGNTRMQRIEATNMHRFGTKAPAQNGEVFERIKRTLVERYGVEHPFESPDILKKAQDTMERNYGVRFSSHLESANIKRKDSLMASHGVTCTFDSPLIQEKIRQTVRARYGTDSTNKVAGVKRKKIETSRKNWGTDYPMQNEIIRERNKKATREAYGVDSVFQSEEIKQRLREISLERYGVDHPMQHPEILERYLKRRFLRKTVVLHGKKFKLQGYEPQALRLLNALGVSVIGFEPVLVSIPYLDGSKARRYIPDFIAGDLVVEVKSDYTAGLTGNKKLRKNVVAKLKGVRAAGKDFLLLVMNKDGTLHKFCFNSFKLTRDIQTHRRDILESALANF